AAVSTGVTQTARVIDQAPVLRAQHIAGAEVGQLHRARIAEIAVPVVLSSILATGTALMVISAVFGGAPSDPLAAVQYLVSVIAACGVAVWAVLVATPRVRRLAVRAAGAAGRSAGGRPVPSGAGSRAALARRLSRGRSRAPGTAVRLAPWIPRPSLRPPSPRARTSSTCASRTNGTPATPSTPSTSRRAR